MSLTITAIRIPWSGDARMCFKRVVFPLPCWELALISTLELSSKTYQKSREQGDRQLPSLGRIGLLTSRDLDMICQVLTTRINNHIFGTSLWLAALWRMIRKNKKKKKKNFRNWTTISSPRNLADNFIYPFQSSSPSSSSLDVVGLISYAIRILIQVPQGWNVSGGDMFSPMKSDLLYSADKWRVLCGWPLRSPRYLNGVADLHGPQWKGVTL